MDLFSSVRGGRKLTAVGRAKVKTTRKTKHRDDGAQPYHKTNGIWRMRSAIYFRSLSTSLFGRNSRPGRIPSMAEGGGRRDRLATRRKLVGR